MNLKEKDLYILGQCALSAALQAGNLIIKYDRTDLQVHKKKDKSSLAGQVVTEVDFMSQDIIIRNLLPVCEIYDLALLTEESTDDKKRLEKDCFWAIDPIDGTLPFINGNEGYSVSIGLVSKDAEPLVGVIYDPLNQVLYSAVKGQGLYRDGKEWNPDLGARGDTLTAVFDISFTENEYYSKAIDYLKKSLKDLGYSNLNIITHGGGALSACWVLEKLPAVFFKFPKSKGGSIWDYAASAAIFKEAGAIATDIYGAPMELNRAETTYMNHKGFVYATSKELAKMVQNLYFNLSGTKF